MYLGEHYFIDIVVGCMIAAYGWYGYPDTLGVDPDRRELRALDNQSLTPAPAAVSYRAGSSFGWTAPIGGRGQFQRLRYNAKRSATEHRVATALPALTSGSPLRVRISVRTTPGRAAACQGVHISAGRATLPPVQGHRMSAPTPLVGFGPPDHCLPRGATRWFNERRLE